MADPANTGIYEIVNLVNGKRYIGSAKYLDKRRGQHWTRLRNGWHHNRYLQSSWSKYGESAFAFRVLLICRPVDLILFEQRSIDSLKPEYNLSPTAGSTLGVVFSEETKRKIALKAIGRKRDPESVERGAAKLRGLKQSPEHVKPRIGNKFALGYRHTDEWKKANSERHKGRSRPKSAEYRAKIAATLRGKYETEEAREFMRRKAADAWKSRSKEQRDRHMEMVRAARGPITEDQRRAISERQIGRKMSAKARAALAAANKGRKLSAEHRQKIGAKSLMAWTVERKIKHSAAIKAAHARRRALIVTE